MLANSSCTVASCAYVRSSINAMACPRASAHGIADNNADNEKKRRKFPIVPQMIASNDSA